MWIQGLQWCKSKAYLGLSCERWQPYLRGINHLHLKPTSRNVTRRGAVCKHLLFRQHCAWLSYSHSCAQSLWCIVEAGHMTELSQIFADAVGLRCNLTQRNPSHITACCGSAMRVYVSNTLSSPYVFKVWKSQPWKQKPMSRHYNPVKTCTIHMHSNAVFQHSCVVPEVLLYISGST